MNKKIGFILAMVLIAFLVMGTASAGLFDFLGGGGHSTAKVANNDSNLIVGFDAEFPPYGFSDGKGGYQGFDLDLAQEVCNRNNWTLVKQPIDWDAKDAELNSGTIDCIWNGFTINGRENDYTWSKPYIDNKQVVVVNSDSGIIAHFVGRSCASITFTFDENTYSERTVDIYGSNTDFCISDMFDSNAPKVGSVTYTQGGEVTFTYTFTDDYSYIGFRSDNGAIYFTSIEVVWR